MNISGEGRFSGQIPWFGEGIQGLGVEKYPEDGGMERILENG